MGRQRCSLTWTVWLGVLLLVTLTAQARTWTDVNGREVEADFVQYQNGLVHLRRPNGQRAIISWDRLSRKDQRYVNFVTATEKHGKGLIGKLAIGAFFGMAPLIIGSRKKHVLLGLSSFILCVAGGAFFGVAAALPMCVVTMIVVGMMPD